MYAGLSASQYKKAATHNYYWQTVLHTQAGISP